MLLGIQECAYFESFFTHRFAHFVSDLRLEVVTGVSYIPIYHAYNLTKKPPDVVATYFLNGRARPGESRKDVGYVGSAGSLGQRHGTFGSASRLHCHLYSLRSFSARSTHSKHSKDPKSSTSLRSDAPLYVIQQLAQPGIETVLYCLLTVLPPLPLYEGGFIPPTYKCLLHVAESINMISLMPLR